MSTFRKKYHRYFRGLSFTLLFLFGLHFLSIHGVIDNLIFCFEENGQINIESETGSIFNIPSEDVVHAEDLHNHESPTFRTAFGDHHDMPLSLVCSKEERVTRFDQQRTLELIDGVLNTRIEQLPPSRIFQFVSFIPPLIEDDITASLQTVVLIN